MPLPNFDCEEVTDLRKGKLNLQPTVGFFPSKTQAWNWWGREHLREKLAIIPFSIFRILAQRFCLRRATVKQLLARGIAYKALAGGPRFSP